MKKVLFGFIIGVTLVFITSAGIKDYVVTKNTAAVESKSGLLIFTHSKPVSEYEYIATVKSGIVINGYYDEVINSIIKKVKKQYPNADAIIFIPNAEAEVIKFK